VDWSEKTSNDAPSEDDVDFIRLCEFHCATVWCEIIVKVVKICFIFLTTYCFEV